MSSFTDEIPQFTPYVQQQPIDAMARVGMQREAEFEKGIQTVQGYYDALLNLPIAKGVTQEYVKSKVGQLNNAVKQSVSGDFSDHRLINQIGGLASQISNDPIVENGIQSTARIQAGMTKMKADQERALKEGKNPIQNIEWYNNKVNEFLGDNDVKTSFSTDYTPYVDKQERFQKILKDVHPDAILTQGDMNALSRIQNGESVPNEILQELGKKGIDAGKIQNIINLVEAQPDVQQQNRIDGWYRFRGLDATQMGEYLTKSTNSYIKMYEDAITNLGLQKATDASVNPADIDKSIKLYKEQYTKLVEKYNATIGKLEKDPEGVKADLVTEEFANDIIGAFSYSETESKWIENPLWNQMDKERKYQLDLYKQKYQETKDKEATEPIAVEGYVNEDQGKAGEGTMLEMQSTTQAKYNALHSRFSNSIAASIGMKEPFKEVDGQWVYNVGSGGYASQKEAMDAVSKVMQSVEQAKTTGIPQAQTADYIKYVLPVADELDQINQTIISLNNKFKPQIEKIIEKIGDEDLAAYYIVKNQLPGWQAYEKKLQVKYNVNDYSYFHKMGLNTPEGAERYAKAYRAVNPDILSVLAAKEKAFKDVQSTFVNKSFSLPSNEPKLAKQNATLFSTILGVYTDASQSAGDKTDYGELQAWLADKDVDKNQYEFRYDNNKKQGYIGIRRGNKFREVSIKDSHYMSIPGANINNEFWSRYGSRLQVSGDKTTGTFDFSKPETTDVRQTGISSALPVKSRTMNNKYIVKHHLEKSIDDKYYIKVWIQEKTPSGLKLVTSPEGQYFDPIGEGSYNRAQILKTIDDVLSDDQSVLGYLKQLNPNYK